MPPQFGEKRDDEVECYTVAIPNLPMFPNRAVKRFIRYIEKLDGYLGMYPCYPRGTLVIFRSENEAKGGRNLIRAYPEYECGVGNNIGTVYVNKKYVKRGKV